MSEPDVFWSKKTTGDSECAREPVERCNGWRSNYRIEVTRKTCRKIASELKRKGFQVEHSTIPRLARFLGYTLRGNRKRLSRKQDDRRDQQRRYIEKQGKRFARKKQPVISVDGKKKEKIGQFRNTPRALRKEPLDVLATDFLSDAIGKATLPDFPSPILRKLNK